ncbi:hypothetical protein FEZ33_00450 [Ruoffia tabacinasalis]|uniref:Uncharacterized protein n=1 Tax=Ruoffia tabacinasalis TaxID=87458 RepID=A0A5R9EKI3_9LACT|nr:hypothetical protein [Ruoffia tabacinasalis]TLQ49491.1 hypothetical protein FEZ33_00450 [Ruoffia tabacinasalis]
MKKPYVGKVFIESEHNFQRYIVFADNIFIAKMLLYQADIIPIDSIGDCEIYHEEKFKDSENASHYKIAQLQWRLGWKFYGMTPPDPDISTENDFKLWYKKEFQPMKYRQIKR